jgi:hypothetical protein
VRSKQALLTIGISCGADSGLHGLGPLDPSGDAVAIGHSGVESPSQFAALAPMRDEIALHTSTNR